MNDILGQKIVKMRIVKLTIDLVGTATCSLALWLGITGRADWWIVILMLLLSHTHFSISIPIGQKEEVTQ